MPATPQFQEQIRDVLKGLPESWVELNDGEAKLELAPFVKLRVQFGEPSADSEFAADTVHVELNRQLAEMIDRYNAQASQIKVGWVKRSPASHCPYHRVGIHSSERSHSMFPTIHDEDRQPIDADCLVAMTRKARVSGKAVGKCVQVTCSLDWLMAELGVPETPDGQDEAIDRLMGLSRLTAKWERSTPLEYEPMVPLVDLIPSQTNETGQRSSYQATVRFHHLMMRWVMTIDHEVRAVRDMLQPDTRTNGHEA